ncbi:MAG: hypothetical protein WAT47_10355, partial [Nostocoides sp.]
PALAPLPRALAIGDTGPALVPLVVGLLGCGAAVLLMAARVTRRSNAAATSPPSEGSWNTAPAPMPSAPGAPNAADADTYDGLAIACSGGGIRSAAFCLGGLQRLMQQGTYFAADRVYAISGGSYVATGLHLARRCSARDATGQPPRDLFAPGSPEMDWLRRHSSFLMPTAGTRTRGLLAVIYGIVSTLAMAGAAMWLVTTYGVWVLDRLPGQAVAVLDQPRATFSVTPWLWGPLAALWGLAALWHVGVNVGAKYERGRLATLVPTATLLAIAGAAGLGLVAIPKLVVLVHNATISNQPTVAMAATMRWTGLVPDAVCTGAVQADFVRQAQIAWFRVPLPATAQSIPFTYGACGQSYTDNAALFPEVATASAGTTGGTKQSASAPASALDAPSCASLEVPVPARPLPSFCDTQKDTTGGWATRLTGLVALATTLGAAYRRKSSGEATTRSGKFMQIVRRHVLPWLALGVLAVIVGIIGMRMGRFLSVDVVRLDSWWTYAVPIGVFALVRLLSDATTASLHPFYRERLSDTFLVRRTEDNSVAPIRLRDMALDPGLGPDSDVDREAPKPQLSILCAANINDASYIPTQRGCTTFRFETAERTHAATRDRAYIGITDSRLPQDAPGTPRVAGGTRPIALSPTAYSIAADPGGMDTTLASAMAASGAAFSPIVGRKQSMVKPYRILLTLGNARLGVWLPNPYKTLVSSSYPEAVPPIATPGVIRVLWERLVLKPGPFRIFKEATGRQSITDSRIYVSDGGHFDNTGIVEALRDRPKLLIVLEASADPAGTLDALTDAITTARMDLGLIITPNGTGYDAIVPGPPTATDPAPRPALPWVHLQARIHSGGPVVTDIYVVKNVMSQVADLELNAYQIDHPDFPTTTTVNQFYGEYDFEAYRQLGWRNTDAMVSANAAALPTG